MNMRIVKDKTKIKYLYHYTKKENIDSILQSKQIRSSDDYIFFTNSYEKSVELFEQEMMSDHYYIDLDCKLKRRVPAKKEDYCIIQIPYKNDGKFVKFIFDKEDTNSIYSKSTIHRGTLVFKKAKVLNLIDNNQNEYNSSSIFNKFKISYASFVATLILSIPKIVYADSWYDHMDTTWNNTIYYSLTLYNESQFAGLSYLINNNQITYNKCNKNANVYNHLSFPQNLDLSTYDWHPFGSNCFCICGIHRIILKSGQRLGSIGKCDSTDRLEILYKCKISKINSQYGTTYIDKTTALTGEKVVITAIPDVGATLRSISINGSNQSLSYFSNEGENRYGFIVNNTNAVIEPFYVRQSYTPTYVFGTGISTSNYRSYYMGDDYSIPINVHPAYRITSIRVNGEEKELENGYLNGTTTGPLTINVETERVGYPVIEDESNSIVIDFTKIKNSLELSYVQHEAISLLSNNAIINLISEMQNIGGCIDKSPPTNSPSFSNLYTSCYTKYIRKNYASIEGKNLLDINDDYDYYHRESEMPEEPPINYDPGIVKSSPKVQEFDSLPMYIQNDFIYFTASEGTTSSDNIYYQLTPEDKEIRNYQGDLIFDKYDSIIIKFGEYNVNETKKKDLIIDYSTIDNYCASPQIFIPYLIDKGALTEEYDEEENVIRLKNKEGKVLAITDTNYYLLEEGKNLTEEDNIEIDIDEEFKEAFPNISSAYNRVSLVFSNNKSNKPKEENNNIIANLVNPKTGRNIMISIIFIVLLSITTIYYKKKKKV